MPSASGPRSGVAMASIQYGKPSEAAGAGAMRRDGPTRIGWSCRRPEILGSAAAAGEGTAIRIFWRRRSSAARSGIPPIRIHLIAICKSLPGRKVANRDLTRTATCVADPPEPEMTKARLTKALPDTR